MSTVPSERVNAVVVLNYKGKDDTMECLRGLSSSSAPHHLSIVLVDNGSGDGVIEEAVHQWPDLVSIQLPENLGFSGGMNAGIRAALGAGVETITILNNDTSVSGDEILQLSQLAVEYDAAVSPTIYYLSEPDRLWFGGGIVNNDCFHPRHMNALEIQLQDEQERTAEPLREVDLLAGCCITASAAVWRRVGELDNRYFLNFEDSDWSLRARDAGVPLLVSKEISIGHKVSASFKAEYSALGHYYFTRNGLLFRQSRGARLEDSWKFLRRYPLATVIRRLKEGRFVSAFELGLMTLAGVVDHLGGRYGKAPNWVEGAAQSISGKVRSQWMLTRR